MAIIKVLHVVSVETENYYLNNLVDFTDNNKISFSFITFGASGGFTREMEKRGCAVYSLNSLKAVKIPAALFKLWRLYKKCHTIPGWYWSIQRSAGKYWKKTREFG
ncbi:MAG: hypothetical protein IPP73_18800 [Chitinophagaceae bacterium]|nr:hypothetical protein [Chitinophagaceae bacterium]